MTLKHYGHLCPDKRTSSQPGNPATCTSDRDILWSSQHFIMELWSILANLWGAWPVNLCSCSVTRRLLYWRIQYILRNELSTALLTNELITVSWDLRRWLFHFHYFQYRKISFMRNVGFMSQVMIVSFHRILMSRQVTGSGVFKRLWESYRILAVTYVQWSVGWYVCGARHHRVSAQVQSFIHVTCYSQPIASVGAL